MPQPSSPPNRVPMLGPGGAIAPEWAQWFSQMHAALTSRQFYVPTVEGAPAFTPEEREGFAAMAYDKTNDRLYVYNPDTPSWVSVALA